MSIYTRYEGLFSVRDGGGLEESVLEDDIREALGGLYYIGHRVNKRLEPFYILLPASNHRYFIEPVIPVGTKEELTKLLLCLTYLQGDYQIIPCSYLDGVNLLDEVKCFGSQIATVSSWSVMLDLSRRLTIKQCLEGIGYRG